MEPGEIERFDVYVTPRMGKIVDKLDEKKNNHIVHLETQVTHLETAKATTEKQMTDYKKKVDNQEKEIQRLTNTIDKLMTKQNRDQTAIENKAKKHAKAIKSRDEKILHLETAQAAAEKDHKKKIDNQKTEIQRLMNANEKMNEI